jgi:replicative DNA helicase
MNTTSLLLNQYGAMPHDEDAEVAVLASILIDPKQTMPFARRLSASSFYKVAHQVIFQAMLDLAEKNGGRFDEVLLADALQSTGALDNIGGRAYLAQLTCHLATAANIEQYVEIVHHKMVLRRLMENAISTLDRCEASDSNVMQLVDEIEKEIMEISKDHTANRTVDMKKLTKDAIAYLEKLVNKDLQAIGLSTGFVDLDNLITGLRPAEMIVLAARPSIGKTSLAMNIASHIAMTLHKPVGVFSLEMSSEMLAVRLLCGESEINQRDIRNGSITPGKWQDMLVAADRLYNAPIFIDDTPALDILELRAKARSMHTEHHVTCIFIDYLQLLRSGSENRNSNRENEVARISSGIKALAKELGIPIVVLAQLNRQAEESGGKPKLSHLRESGSIEQDADIVMMLHGERAGEPSRKAELMIVKQRNGAVGNVDLLFFGAQTRFRSVARVEDKDVPRF